MSPGVVGMNDLGPEPIGSTKEAPNVVLATGGKPSAAAPRAAALDELARGRAEMGEVTSSRMHSGCRAVVQGA